jgi:hypothetical protein
VLGRISYQEKEQENLIWELVSRNFKRVDESNPEDLVAFSPADISDEDESKAEFSDRVPDVSQQLMIPQHVGALKDSVVVKAFLKADAFAEEQEWRVLFVRPEGASTDILFRTAKGMLVPYIAWDLRGEDGRLPISAVTIGPTLHPQQAKASLERFLRLKDLEYIEVTASTIPLRA